MDSVLCERLPYLDLFVRCKAWAPQRDKMLKDIGKACRWKHPRKPSARLFWKEGAKEAVLGFLRSTRVRCLVALRRPPEEEEGDQ